MVEPAPERGKLELKSNFIVFIEPISTFEQHAGKTTLQNCWPPIECPSIKITPPVEETKPAVTEEQPMETSQAVKPIDTSPQGTTTLPDADQTDEPKPTDSRPGTNTVEQVSVVSAEQGLVPKSTNKMEEEGKIWTTAKHESYGTGYGI
ncbi:uncharacterized protein LOC117112426 isoform X3 [Anneissia japonica]|uniref:uncharacterized protein LOC117112426 isoform X3 n=1 Tax=Anneissia japonica TaxID=1529436 RepID=UPI00142564E8|nr:uncharacterized protein LOC117112426 isoform X3 [Anneissia japonica]